MEQVYGRVAILYPATQTTGQKAKVDNDLFAGLFRALADKGIQAEPTAYHDDLCAEVKQQLFTVDGVLVWINPIEAGHDRTILDALLREVADAGIFVSTHPDIILKMGTKEVLYHTRDMGWGCDTHLYCTAKQMNQELPLRLATGRARVLKQYRGNGGSGVWKVQLPPGDFSPPKPDTLIRVRHAMRGAVEEEITWGAFLSRCQEYFVGDGRVIDQEYQERLPEGMIRCYLVHDKVAGFGHQAINALYPAPPDAPPAEAPQPGPRFYHPPTKPEFQALKRKLEQEWVPAMQKLLEIETRNLPILWDCDFLLGPKDAAGDDTYVLCEINVSSVSPFPESASPAIAEVTATQIQTIWQAHYLARLHAERADLLWQLRGLSEEAVSRAEVMPGWTVKDILAHIPYYDAAFAGRIQMVLDGRTADLTPLTDDNGLANRNAQLLAQNRHTPYEQVLAMLLKERSGFTAVLKRVPDERLRQNLTMPWGQETSIQEWAAWRYEHDADHGRQLAVWRETQPRETLRDVTPIYVLRAMLHSSRKAFQALLSLIPQAAWTTRSVCGVWTMKDLLGHLTDWEKVAVNGLRPLAAGQTPEFGYTLDNFDDFNNKNAAARADQNWDEVWADYEATRTTLLDLLAQTSPADLQRTFMAPWGREISGGVWLLIWPGHEMEHAVDVRAALELHGWPPRFVKHE